MPDSVLGPTVVAKLQKVLVSQYGGFLRNPVREHGVTCGVCTTPVDGYPLCRRCNEHRRTHGPHLADAIGFFTYAADTQSHYIMRGYKAPSPIAEHTQVVALLALTGVAGHTGCAARLGNMSLTHWAVVPSLPRKPLPQHPLRPLVRPALTGAEVSLQAASTVSDARAVDVEHFAAPPLPRGSHVLLVDDTWTGGGHVQSAVLALRKVGAARVSALVLARWLNPDWPVTAKFIASRLQGRDFNPLLCPWTSAACP
jgi:hypothetical protein